MVAKKVISCIEAVGKMFELLEGALPNPEKKQLDEHVNMCYECCDRLEFEKLLKEKMNQLGDSEQPSEALKNRIDAMLKEI